MRELVREWRRSPAIIAQAVTVIYHTGPKDELAEIDALFSFVRDSIRYTRDVHEVETVATPLATLDRRVGDCDDKSTLFATLCESVGYPTRFVMAGYQSPSWEHVYCQVLTSQGWIDADATEIQPLGYAPPNPLCIHQEHI